MTRLVLCHAYIVGLRATQMFQDKAQFAENGMSFSRTATPYWSIWVAPFGRAVKQSSAVLHLLVRARPLPAKARLAVNRFTTR